MTKPPLRGRPGRIDLDSAFGAEVRVIRRELRIPALVVAERLGCSLALVTKVERGQRKPLLADLIDFAIALGIEPETLLGRTVVRYVRERDGDHEAT